MDKRNPIPSQEGGDSGIVRDGISTAIVGGRIGGDGFRTAVRASISISVAEENERGKTVDDCIKVQIDRGLLSVDCEGCVERPICPMRANRLMEKYSMFVGQIGMASRLNQMVEFMRFGLHDLSANEVDDLLVYRQEIESVKVELHKKAVREAESGR